MAKESSVLPRYSFGNIDMDQVPEDLVKDVFGFTAPTGEQLQNITMWAKEALRLKEEITLAEAHLKGLSSELADIEEKKLPQSLLVAGMLEFTMMDGSEISIKDVIQ